MQAKKKKGKRSNRTPEEVAKDFWIDIHQTIQNRLMQSIKDGDESPDEKKHYLSYIDSKRSLPDDAPVGGLKDLVLEHHFLVKPYLPWDKIKSTLKAFNIDDRKIQTLVCILKPSPIEQKFIPDENPLYARIVVSEENVCDEFNREIRELSPLVKRLKNLQEVKGYEDFAPLILTILKLEYDLEVYREIVKRKRITDKQLLAVYCIDKDLKKSPQKHKYWNVVVSSALKILNPFCHSDNCETSCRKTHQKAITAIAELLKILYPSIWKEDVKTIASRIKQKDYRNIPA